MKKFSARKGFTLVELMIVIAIIGILAAVLYPTFTGFMEGARDTSRQTSLKNYSVALISYQQDNNIFPKTNQANNSGTNTAFCIKDLYNNHLKSYMPKGIENDPKGGNGVKIGSTDCTGANGGYAYKALKAGGETAFNGNAYVLGAKMEKWANANFNAAGTTGANGTKSFAALANREEIKTFTKGSTESQALKAKPQDAYYIVSN